MSTFFISDLHLGHINVLKFDNRPFKTIEAHDRAVVENWNSAVGFNDDVWILGDVSFHNATKTLQLLSQLNGTKHLCIGNHDHKLLRNRDFQNQFVEITNYKEIHLSGNSGIVLCHFPMVFYNQQHNGWFHLYGHVHNSYEYQAITDFQNRMRSSRSSYANMFNVGCMMPYMNYTPRQLDQIVLSANKEVSA